MPTTAAATVEPVAWDPHQQIHPDTPLSDLPVLGLAVATAGLAPTAPIIGLQTASGADIRASLFKPDHPLPADGQAARSMALSRLRPEHLAGGRCWETIRPRMAAYLESQVGAVVTTHNAAYHLGVLAARHVPPPPTVCTMRVALALGRSPWPPVALPPAARMRPRRSGSGRCWSGAWPDTAWRRGGNC